MTGYVTAADYCDPAFVIVVVPLSKCAHLSYLSPYVMPNTVANSSNISDHEMICVMSDYLPV